MDIMLEMAAGDETGLILLVGYEKTFDSLSWSFITQTLELFNFGENIIGWFETLRKNSKSCVTLNGHLLEYFALEQGCRQGDPISPYLFILCGEILSTAIRNDPKIEGLTIHNEEHKISQYADDTSLYLKDTERCLSQALTSLKWFHSISGLKINIKKTKVIRIGNIRETDRRYCRENDLDWVNVFVSLGIIFKVNDMGNITNYNIEAKLKDIRNLLNVWLMRNITPMGRIQVAKSLALSKITHILLSLPSPDKETVTKLDNLLTNFVWRNKRHCVNRDMLQTQSSKGGVNMINVNDFDLGLKITWLRKLRKEEKWFTIAQKLNMENLFIMRPKEILNIKNRCHNPFWKDVCRAAIKLHNLLSYNDAEEIRKAPLWGNTRINIPTCHSWYKKGIVEEGDLFDTEGEVRTLEEIQEKIGNPIPFVTYHGIVSAIPRTWKASMRENLNQTENLQLSKFQAIIIKDNKGCRSIRDVFQNKDIVPWWEGKWNNSLTEVIDRREWAIYYNNNNKTRARINLQYFQYQVLTRTLVTNKKLKQFKISEDDNCSFCNNEAETIEHLFFYCPKINDLWGKYIKWVQSVNYNKIELDIKLILLGPKKIDPLLFTIITIVKQIIYKKRHKNKAPTLAQIQCILKYHMNIERYIAMCNNRIPHFLGKWSPIHKLLSDT